MSFISKILDAFKLESTREMENSADNSARHNEMPVSEPQRDIKRVEKLADIAYNDRFYEDYRPAMQKTMAFTGNNFSEPAIQACAALIISGSVKRGEKIKPNDYYKYFENLYGVVNIRKLHLWLYENGYLRNATPKEALNLYKVDELKTILDSMGLKKTGNKRSLIERIEENPDDSMKEKLSNECDRYFRSKKGEIFLLGKSGLCYVP